MTSVEWVAGKVRYIDQSKLPHEERFIETADYHVIGEAIKRLQIRGAPAIGIAAAFAVCLAVNDQSIVTAEELEREFMSAANHLAQTRPTAVNLFAALTRMRRVYKQYSPLGVIATRLHLLEEAIAIHQEDIEACRKIGRYGATLLNTGAIVLTHCNTGALATGGEGTALSIITTAAKEGKIRRVYVDETRPLLQGARLTSWELLKQQIETVLITDSTAGYVLQQSLISAVFVGADRIAANGDVANKIGTYPLAVLAERHMVPFYVAAPTSSIDSSSKSGAHIPVEERASEEITHIAGVHVAAEGVGVYAPAFDITPGQLVTAIITEAGILRPPYNVSIERLKLLGGSSGHSGL